MPQLFTSTANRIVVCGGVGGGGWGGGVCVWCVGWGVGCVCGVVWKEMAHAEDLLHAMPRGVPVSALATCFVEPCLKWEEEQENRRKY